MTSVPQYLKKIDDVLYHKRHFVLKVHFIWIPFEVSGPETYHLLWPITQILYGLIISSLWKYRCPNFDCNDPIRSQFCSCHDSWAVVSWAKLRPDCTIIFHARALYIFMSFGLIAHNRIVKWVTGNICTDLYIYDWICIEEKTQIVYSCRLGNHFVLELFKVFVFE